MAPDSDGRTLIRNHPEKITRGTLRAFLLINFFYLPYYYSPIKPLIMAKKQKKTSEFSKRADRIYRIVHKAVTARTPYLAVVRNIDNELDKVSGGGKLKEEITELKKDLKEVKAEKTGLESELKGAQEVIQDQQKDIDTLKELNGNQIQRIEELEKSLANTPDADPVDAPGG